MKRPFDVRAEDGLTWFPERGIGYYPVRTNGHPVYDQAYFDNYAALSQTEMGRRLTAARLALVSRYLSSGTLIDVGVGSGAFVEARQAATGAPTLGYDINPVAITWLMERQLFRDPQHERVDGLTFWDSLEHIHEPYPMLQNAEWHFVSLPIFAGPDHALSSKHFKRDEHCWYFTRDGLINWFAAYGFVCREHNTMESLLGREGIGTFVFQAVAP